VIREDEFREQLARAADEFRVRAAPPDLQRRVLRRRRATAAAAVTAGVSVAAAVVLVVALAAGAVPGPDRSAPPGHPLGSPPRGDYIGSGWRLTSVAEGGKSTTIPANITAWMALLPDGQILINTEMNGTSGRYSITSGGFQVRDVVTSGVGYAGHDPRTLAAIAGLKALAYPSSPSSPARDTLISVDASTLVVQAGRYRLTFHRTGPAIVNGDEPQASATPS
jgi:hypothetical protein